MNALLGQRCHAASPPSSSYYSRPGVEDHFLVRFWLTMRDIDQLNVPTLAIGLGTIAFVPEIQQLR